VGSGRVTVPPATLRSAMLGDRSVVLLPYVWRDFQPGGPVRGAYFSGTIRSPDGSVPARLTVSRFWLVMDTEVWTASPAEVRSWTSPQTGVVTFEVVGSDGPSWEPGKLVRAIVRISYLGDAFDIEADSVEVHEVS
jgi:hypothetical protein